MSFIEVSNLSRNYRTVIKQKGFSGAIKNLVKTEYKIIEAVKDINFSIEKGEAVGFIGPNGAGKSTTVKMLTGILLPNKGDIIVNDVVPYKQRKKHTANIGIVFGQRSQLWWDLPISDTFDLLRYVYRIEKKVFDENLERFNDMLGLHEFFNQPVRQLSLGQRMRADIAASLLHNPPCLFLDEPTIGLDIIAKEKIRQFIRQINKENKTTVLFTTHDMVDLEKTCDRMIIIDYGSVIYDGSIGHITKKFGKERSLIVDFNKKYSNISINGVSVSDDSDFKKNFTFKRDDIKISELITEITSNYDVADLTIREPDIDSIVRQIYENGVGS